MTNKSTDTNRELGRKKLMMRLPLLRDQLRRVSGEQIESMFVDYERVSRSRDKVRAQKGAPPEWAADYKNLMLELEEGVRQYLAGQRWQDFQ